jgi:flagellin
MQINGSNTLDPNVYLNANQALNRISSGSQINQASDDSSGLAIANQLLFQANGYSQAVENTNSGLALTQIADDAISEQSNILNNVKEKLLQASTDTTSQEGREALLKDIQGQLENFDNITSSTNYNGQTLLQQSSDDSSSSEALQFQAGLSGEDVIDTTSVQANTEGLGLEDLLTQDASTFTSSDARAFLENIDNALSGLNDIRGEFGAVSNQLQSSTRSLLTQETQTLGANSVNDTDYAKESANFSKQNILAQIGAFGIAQSNNINQNTVTRLLS